MRHLQELKSNSDISRFRVPSLEKLTPATGYRIEYVNARTMGSLLDGARVSDIDHLSNSFRNLFKTLRKGSCNCLENGGELSYQDTVVKKFYEVKQRLADGKWIGMKSISAPESYPASQHFLDAINLAQRSIVEGESWAGLIHGDLSLGNVLVGNRLLSDNVGSTAQLFLIDANPGPVNAILVDVGRLLMDLRYGWWDSFGNESSRFRSNRFRLGSAIENFAVNELGMTRELISGSILFAVFRVLPYTFEVDRIALLKHIIAQESGFR